MSERTATTYNTILGRGNHGEIIMFDGTFEYSHGFRGATGTRFEVIEASEVEQRLEDFEEYAEEIWRMRVSEGTTTDGLSDWVENNFPDDESKIDYMFDSSYSQLHDTIRELFDLSEDDVITCIGGGRMFPDALEGLEWLPGQRKAFEQIILNAESD